jgi:hypothetical protein
VWCNGIHLFGLPDEAKQQDTDSGKGREMPKWDEINARQNHEIDNNQQVVNGQKYKAKRAPEKEFGTGLPVAPH